MSTQVQKSKSHPNSLDPPLAALAAFVESLSREPLSAGSFVPEVIFSDREDGTLLLSGQDAERYRECLRQITRIAISGEKISPRTVERLVQRAILESLDINDRRSGQALDQRLDEAIQSLKASVSASPRDWQVYYPVGGLATDGLPVDIGKATFCVFGHEDLDRFKSIDAQQTSDEEIRKQHAELIDMYGSSLIGEPVCKIDVSAIDPEAAGALALKEMRLRLDIINFYADVLPTHGRLYVVGEANGAVVTIPALTQGDIPAYNLQSASVGPLGTFSLPVLLDHDARRQLGFAAICRILAGNGNALQNRLVAAMQWAGRATVDSRREEAFLLYAIALESLILADQDPIELTYRLRIRVAHLLGREPQARRRLSKRVGDLYTIRSKIVHNGKYEVSDTDLNDIRVIAKNCILRVLLDDPFVSMTTNADLATWFDEQILNGPDSVPEGPPQSGDGE